MACSCGVPSAGLRAGGAPPSSGVFDGVGSAATAAEDGSGSGGGGGSGGDGDAVRQHSKLVRTVASLPNVVMCLVVGNACFVAIAALGVANFMLFRAYLWPITWGARRAARTCTLVVCVNACVHSRSACLQRRSVVGQGPRRGRSRGPAPHVPAAARSPRGCVACRRPPPAPRDTGAAQCSGRLFLRIAALTGCSRGKLLPF